MDDPLSRALREEEEGYFNFNQNDPLSSSDPVDSDVNENVSSLSISHGQNEWILPSTNVRKEEVEINREQTKISVGDPKRHKSNLDTFITYLITTQIFNDGVQTKESHVRRRYNDFVWLKATLDNKYPYNIISPLPAKHTLSKKLHVVADDGEFIRRRMLGLQSFLRRIVDNPVISIDPYVQLFLYADDDKLHSTQQEQQPSAPLSPSAASTKSHPFRQTMGRGKPIPSEFSRTENQIQTLQDNLRKLERLSRKVESDQIAVHAEEEHLLGAFKQWLDVERKYAEDDSLVETICNTQQTIVDNESDLIQFTNTKFIEPVNEYILFTSIVQDILKRRAQLAESTAASNSEEMFDQLTIANETIKADIQRWTESKDKELSDLFHSLANKKVEFYAQSVNAWEQAAAKLAPSNGKR